MPLASQSVDRGRDLGLDLGAAGSRAARASPSALGRRRSVGDRGEQLLEGLVEQLDAVRGQLVGDLLERDAELVERGERVLRRRRRPRSRLARGRAVVAEGLERRRRHGVDGVGPDQLLDVAERRGTRGFFVLVLAHSSRCTLAPCVGERLPALAGDDLLEALVGELRVGDRDLALELARAARRSAAPLATSSSCASAIVSMRLTKKLATEAMRDRSPPLAAQPSSPVM